ncbi:hypothetical protein EV702DRAFT_1270564 [Suillus placidus]|uniref:Uncharacterized protein n=1 Tax=Suillus placidus TaxID=48579 RepID=A0A9P6ZMX2_9AGAM|nr:hypothetical protein EV702DRAFT_1270564 [Suillus placidus]
MTAIIFAFVGHDREGYYINNGRSSRWHNAPKKLITVLNSMSASQIKQLFGGTGGRFFIEGQAQNSNRTSDLDSHSGFELQKIRWHAFGAGQSEWLSLLTPSGHVFNKIPDSLKEKIEKIGAGYIWTVSIGVDDAWAMTLGATHLEWENVPPNLHEKLKSGRVIRNIVLSPWDWEHWWIEYGNGDTDFSLPQNWTDDINSIRHK